MNEKITAKEVRLISVDGEQLGIVPTEEALERAQEDGLDLMEVSPNADPPVCRILNFGKLKYEEKKKIQICLLYTSPSPRDGRISRMPSSA